MYYVYMMTNVNRTVIYTGFCNNLARRVSEHKNKSDTNSFTAKYNLFNLIYFEVYNEVNDAIAREKQIKKYSRKKKDALVVSLNQNWDDLSFQFT